MKGGIGTGACELDALDALHPGELARIVENAVKQFIDPDLEEALANAEQQANDLVEVAWHRELQPIAGKLATIERRAGAIARQYQGQFSALKREMDKELEPLQEQLDELKAEIMEVSENFSPELPERPEPETYADTDEWLFDSTRDYG